VKALPVEQRPGECVDCAALFYKPADLVPGEEALYGPEFRPVKPRPTDGAPRKPRCATHKRAEKKRAKAAAHATYVTRTYGISKEFQAALWAFQGNACPCGRQPTRFPDTDHDHRLAREHDHPEDQACEECMRGLCCRACNTYVLGRYSPAQLRALARYLESPPAQELLIAMDEDVSA
jgi:hypothetical protein